MKIIIIILILHVIHPLRSAVFLLFTSRYRGLIYRCLERRDRSVPSGDRARFI